MVPLEEFEWHRKDYANMVERTMEYEADMYGLNAARQPDGEANVDMMLGEYRKLDPGPVEESSF